MEMCKDIYANTEIINRMDQNKKNSGCVTVGCYRWTTVGLLLLCVLLLAVIVVLTVKNDQLQTSYKNLTIENDQLQTSYTNLTIKNDQLQTSYENLIIDQLQRENNKCLEQIWKHKFGSSLYYFSTERKNWTESRKACRDMNVDLVKINSLDELKFIMDHLVCEHGWVGLSQAPNEGKWTWEDGTELNTNSEFWCSYQPDNFNNNENCGEVWNSSDLKKLNDRDCSYEQQWICEKSAS